MPRIVGPIHRPHPVQVRDLEFLRSHTDRPVKMTVPGPFTMTQQAQNDHYPDLESAAMDYAKAVNAEIKDLFAAGADVVQIDEPYLQARPDAARAYGLAAVNAALHGVEGTTAVHLCFGYAAIIHERPSGYSFLPELAGCPADQISIETAQSGLDLGVLADLSDKTIILGVLDLSTPEVETAEVVAARVRRAYPYRPAERLVIAPDCGMKYLPRESAEGKMRAMVGAAALLRAELSRRSEMQLVTEENITDLAAARWGTARDPRLAEIMQALVRHLHDFAREVRLTEPEWMAAIQWLTRTGQISDEKREEFILASDVLGLSMLVVQMNHRLEPGATPATVLGPFHIEGSPELGVRRRHVRGPARHPALHQRDGAATSTASAGRRAPSWTCGRRTRTARYEAQLAESTRRGCAPSTHSKSDGTYCVRTIAPLGYSIPMDGPVGDLIARTEISHFRPAHVHFLLNVPGFEPLITHLFQEGAEYLDSDVVFGTKRSWSSRSSPGSRDRPRTAARRRCRGCWRSTTSCCSRRPDRTEA